MSTGDGVVAIVAIDSRYSFSKTKTFDNFRVSDEDNEETGRVTVGVLRALKVATMEGVLAIDNLRKLLTIPCGDGVGLKKVPRSIHHHHKMR